MNSAGSAIILVVDAGSFGYARLDGSVGDGAPVTFPNQNTAS